MSLRPTMTATMRTYDAMPEEMPCHFCAGATPKTYYCFGCRTVVCECCEVPGEDLPCGPHALEDHVVELRWL